MSANDQTTKALDGFYCAKVIIALWADAVSNRLEGPAIYLLTDELAEVSEHARAAAHELADPDRRPRRRDHTDPVSHQLVTRLLGDETHRHADIEAALHRS